MIRTRIQHLGSLSLCVLACMQMTLSHAQILSSSSEDGKYDLAIRQKRLPSGNFRLVYESKSRGLEQTLGRESGYTDHELTSIDRIIEQKLARAIYGFEKMQDVLKDVQSIKERNQIKQEYAVAYAFETIAFFTGMYYWAEDSALIKANQIDPHPERIQELMDEFSEMVQRDFIRRHPGRNQMLYFEEIKESLNVSATNPETKAIEQTLIQINDEIRMRPKLIKSAKLKMRWGKAGAITSLLAAAVGGSLHVNWILNRDVDRENEASLETALNFFRMRGYFKSLDGEAEVIRTKRYIEALLLFLETPAASPIQP